MTTRSATAPSVVVAPGFGDDRQHAQLLDRVAQFARIADVDREALQALHRLADVLAADRERDDLLHVGEREAEARRADAINMHLDIATPWTRSAYAERVPGTVLDGRFDLLADLLDHLQDRDLRS